VLLQIEDGKVDGGVICRHESGHFRAAFADDQIDDADCKPTGMLADD
jgi:hypothetical protein